MSRVRIPSLAPSFSVAADLIFPFLVSLLLQWKLRNSVIGVFSPLFSPIQQPAGTHCSRPRSGAFVGATGDQAELPVSRLPGTRRRSSTQESATTGWNCRNGNNEPASAPAPRRQTFQPSPRRPGSRADPSPKRPGQVARFPVMTTVGIASGADRPRVEALCFSRRIGIQPAGRSPRRAVCAGATSMDRYPAGRMRCPFAKTAR